VIERDALREPVRLVAGADVSYDRGSPVLYAAVVVLDAESLELVEIGAATLRATFPYVPGYLSFRELPALLAAFAQLLRRPDLVLCDGHGRAHPRRFGLACHLGVALDLPVIGCAKSRLVGTHRKPGPRRGAHVALCNGAERIGSVLRTRKGVAPVYVSVGHRVSLATARRLVLRFTPRFRVPEPIRAAHAEVNRLRREATGDPLEGPRGEPQIPCFVRFRQKVVRLIPSEVAASLTLPPLRIELVEEAPQQELDVSAPLPERWKEDRNHAQAVHEVLTERPPFHLFSERAALASLARGAPEVAIFVAAMVGGIWIYRFAMRPRGTVAVAP